MRKNVFLMFTFILVLFIYGCGTGQKGEEGNVNYVQGTQGLDISFMNGMPPQYIYSGDVLTIGLNIENKGTYDLPAGAGSIYLGGYDKSIIGNLVVTAGPSTVINNGGEINIQGNNPDGSLFGRDLYNDNGDQVYYEFQSSPIDNIPTPIYDFKLLAYLFYRYETDATANVCLDPKPHRTNVDKPCITAPISLGSQGAPVAVTSVDITPSGAGKARMIINIQNVGNGDIVDLDAFSNGKGPTELLPSDLNLVEFEIHGSNTEPQCTFNYGNKVRLDQSGHGRVVCTVFIDKSAVTSYMSSFNIVLKYAYRTSVRKNVEIRQE